MWSSYDRERRRLFKKRTTRQRRKRRRKKKRWTMRRWGWRTPTSSHADCRASIVRLSRHESSYGLKQGNRLCRPSSLFYIKHFTQTIRNTKLKTYLPTYLPSRPYLCISNTSVHAISWTASHQGIAHQKTLRRYINV